MSLLTQIGTSGIKDNAITTAKVAADAVTQPKIGAGAVGTTEIADNAVLTGKIQDGTLTTADLTDNAVNNAKIATGIASSKLTGALPALDGSSLTNVGTERLIKEIIISSNTASVAFIHGSNSVVFDGTYKQYRFEVMRALPATDNVNLLIEITTDGGSSYKTGFSQYCTVSTRSYYNATGSGANDSPSATHSIYVSAHNVSSDGDRGGFNCSLSITKPSLSQMHSFFGNGYIHTDDNFSIVNNSMGTFDTAVGTYNGFRFRFTSGDVASGTFRLYGVV